jgi:peptidyl-prolyl cis-trans isomerase D
MLEVIRNFLRSKFGAAAAIALLILIAIGFASMDISSTGVFGGIAGGDRVATVGDDRIDSSTLRDAVTTALERAKQEDPKMSMQALLASGGLEDILDELADRLAVAVFGREHGQIVSPRLVDSEIASVPAFQGANGEFSQDVFRQALQQQAISEAALREDLEQSLIARQVLIPASFGAIMPGSLTKRYAALLSESRTAEIAVLPSMLFAPEKDPDDKQLAAYYAANEDNFIRPERRIIRYASFDPDIVEQAAKATDAEIAARYKENAVLFQASETRELSQLVVPTEAAAKAIVAETDKGVSLEAAAKTKGLSVARIAASDKTKLTKDFSKAVADSAFAAKRGEIAKPARSALGWHVMRIDNVTQRPARSLDQVRSEIAQQITREKQAAALAERLEEIEDEFAGGANLAEVAKELGIDVQRTQPLTADGRVYGKVGQSAPDILEKVIETAFLMDLEDPQLAIIERGEQFVIFDVTDIAPSAPAPLSEIKNDVIAAYKLHRGSAEARKAAEKVQAQVRKGASLAKAMNSLGKRTIPPETISFSRPQLMQMQREGEGIPAPIVLMFQMAEGTVKVQAAPDKQAWFIVKLDEIDPGEVKDDDPELAQARRDLGRVAGDEYAQALRRAIRNQVGVEKNEAAIRAVREQLGGNN